MFDIGWTEMLVIAIVMIVVVGPKDLPKMLRTFGRTTSKMRAMAGDFRKQFDEALKEAELDDVKKSVDELRSLNPTGQLKKAVNPFQKAADDVRAGLDSLKAQSPPKPASTEVHPAEPLKNGATNMPGVEGPTTMPPAPAVTGAPHPAAALEPMATPVMPEPASTELRAAEPLKNGAASSFDAPAKPKKPRAPAKPRAPKAAAATVAAAEGETAPKPKRARKAAAPKAPPEEPDGGAKS
ncbi:MAG: Sec-independent protein translocase protein TatB [Rhizobiaceae bacterium]